MGDRGFGLLVVLAISLGTVSTGSSAPGYRLASFSPARGWLVVRAGASNPSLVVAVTASDASAVHPVALFGSLKKLSRDGVLAWVDTVGRGRSDFPATSRWPPQLTSFHVEHGWEGQPAANIQQRVWTGEVDGWDLDVRVFFATQRPSAAVKAVAQAEIRRLRLP